MKLNLKYLIYFQIIYNFFLKFFISDFGIPSILNYVTDIITIILFLGVICNKKKKNIKSQKISPLIFVYIFFIINLISFLLDFSNPLLFIWGFRNLYRFFMFFYSCIYLLTKEDISKILQICQKVFIINFIICMYEYFLKGIKYDDLGGIFGNHIIGGNGPLNVFLILMIICTLVEYIHNKKSLTYLIFILLSSILIASFAELKVVFFEIILVFILIPIFLKRNYKIIITMILIILVGVIGLKSYIALYPERADFISIDYVEKYALNDSYGEESTINRFSAITYIEKNIFKKNIKYKTIGLGLGNAERSQFKFLTSNFYKKYGNLLKYDWFSHAFMFIETGYIGLLTYILFFIKIGYDSYQRIKEDYLYNITFLFSIFCLIFFVYNQTLRLETMGYTIFFILSIPYILKKKKYKGANSYGFIYNYTNI